MPNAHGSHCFVAGGIMEALLLIAPKETKEIGIQLNSKHHDHFIITLNYFSREAYLFFAGSLFGRMAFAISVNVTEQEVGT